MSSRKTPSVAQILLAEENQSQKRSNFIQILLALAVLYLILWVLNIYFTYPHIFSYMGSAVYKSETATSTGCYSPWSIAMALEIPFYRFNFQNPSTPLILNNIILTATCENDSICSACTGGGSSCDIGQCQISAQNCGGGVCRITPQMFCGAQPNPQKPTPASWVNPNNPFACVIDASAPILSSDYAAAAINSLWTGGFVALAESLSNLSAEEFWGQVFGQRPLPPCKSNPGAYAASIAQGAVTGVMAGSLGGVPGAIIGGILTAGLSAFTNKDKICQ